MYKNKGLKMNFLVPVGLLLVMLPNIMKRWGIGSDTWFWVFMISGILLEIIGIYRMKQFKKMQERN
ncbi:hypothetical protein [Chryseobacterium luteum]|uniref:Uncharacterized protein n=1 Tax=Chryseobacterium luteum TaxID=421531 RepID=A0A085Z0E0_9FLAO|nr:hypothetical protein [Chryseobacterium luteum]KFE97903.1 hypothetical protein IX38_19770 [Chryseobacterium luteum]